MSLDERAKATAENIEGKARELGGKVTGNKGEQAKGKVKQGEASVHHAVEDVKEELNEKEHRDD